nr:hypothetical protein [Verminephrobacter eiseniae]
MAAHALGLLLHALLPEPLACRGAVAVLDALAQFANGLLERATVIVLAIGLAVAFETPALVDVEQRPGKLARGQGLMQALGAQLVGVQPLQFLALGHLGRKKAMLHQLIVHAFFALEQTVPAPAHGAGHAAVDCQRLAVGIATIAEDANPRPDDGRRLTRLIQPKNSPSQRSRSQIQRQAISDGLVHWYLSCID